MNVQTVLNGDTESQFEEYVEDSKYDNKSAATRELIQDGLRERGYHPNESTTTELNGYLTQLARGLAIAGLILAGMSITGNPGVQIYTITVFAVATVLTAANHLANAHSDRLTEIVNNG